MPTIDTAFFGTAPGGSDTYNNLLTYFDQITPENAGKWGSVESTQDDMQWADLDTAYQFAQDNDLPFKFHVLVWGQQQPDFMSGDTLTDEEKLAEIDEWMAAVADRYPELELIEVVNEPLHAEPDYKSVLGGDGDTGWDWVITAFEMARSHFPDATLILNDYQILHLEQFTSDYLEIITALQNEDLIDAIGVQAHFLERTPPSMVQTNLDTLAETGLPIYVSEFDLNFADDARHANVMKDLFPVFWDHPRVAGVTHWGHLEGTTWRENAYLLREDGTERPGLEWLVCYLDGGGDSCAVPEYVPSGWQGDEYGLTLEAELYDEGEGLLALGGQVAYTNDGNWIQFIDVEFQDGWDTLWVNYTKGNDMTGSISVHLDSLENAPVTTVDLPSTGGWGASDKLEIDMTGTMPTATHDVFIRFNIDDPEEGVANLDNVRFGRPRPTSDLNLVTDSGFEGASPDGGWSAFGSSSDLNLTTGQFYEGLQSLEVSNRTGTGGFVAYWLTDKVSAGTSYSVSAQVRHDGASADTVRMVGLVKCEGEDDDYQWLHNNTAVDPNTWTELSNNNLEIPAGCGVNEVQLFFEGPAETSTVYIDEVKVVPPRDANLVAGGNFEGESLLGGWSDFGNSETAVSLEKTAPYHTGAQSLFVDRSSTTNGDGFASYNLADNMTAGLTYLANAWVYQDGTAADTVRMSALVGCDGEANDYLWIENNTSVAEKTWTQLSGDFEIPLDCEITDVQLYFEGTTAGVDVYIDDVSVTLPVDNLVTDGGFEGSSLDGGWGVWYTSGTDLSLATDKVYAGSQSLLASNRSENSHPSYDLTSLVEAGTTYSVSAQALHMAGGSDTLTMTAKRTCDGTNDYLQLQEATGVASDTWTELSNTLSIPAGCGIDEVRIYFEGTTTGVDVYLDEVSVVAN
jgi:GH35 family endo-1,4-beta-xylanase